MHTMRQMNDMMNSLVTFNDPFSIMGQHALMPHDRGSNNMSLSLFDPNFGRFNFVSMICEYAVGMLKVIQTSCQLIFAATVGQHG